MNIEVHHADPRLRRLAALLVAGVVLLGGLGLWALRGWLDAHAVRGLGDYDSLLLLAVGLVVVLATVSFAIASALWFEARRIQLEDRFPPSDMRTLRDVPVRRGAQAARYARFMLAGAVVAACGGVAILLWGYWLFRLAV